MKKLIVCIFLLSAITLSAQKKWSLEECINYAKEHNIDILRQELQNQSLEEDITIAKGNYFPDFSFNASEGVRFTRGAFDASTGITTSSSNSTSFGFSSGMTLFNGNRNKYTLQQAKIAAQKGEIDIDRIALDISLDITNAYLQVLFNKELLGIREEQEIISKQEVERLTKLYEAILKSKSELLQIKSTHASDIKELAIAQNNLNTSLINLKQLLGINDINDFDVLNINVSAIETSSILYDSNSIYENALQNNPLIKSTELQSIINEKSIKIAKSNLYPSLNLSAGYNTNFFGIEGGDNIFFQQLQDNQSQNISLSLNVPIFNRFATRSNISKAKVELDIIETDLSNQKNELKNRIEIAYNDVFAAKASLEASLIASEAQQEVFDIDQQKFRENLMPSNDYLESKSNFIRVESELVQAKYDYIFKIKILEYYK